MPMVGRKSQATIIADYELFFMRNGGTAKH